MSTGEYLAGVVFFALMLGGVLAGSALLLRRRYPQLSGVERILAYALIGTLGVLAVHLVPMIFGVMSRWTVVAAAAFWVLAAWRVAPARPEQADRPPAPARESGLVAWSLSGLSLAAVALFVLVWIRTRVTVPSTAIDWLNFHLPGVAAWIQTGSIWQIDVYLADLAPGHYPGNGDIMYLATIVPWRDDFLAHFAIYPFLVLTALAVYALAAELRAPRAAAAGAAAVIAAMPAVLQPTLSGGLVDAVMLFGFATGLLFLLRHARNGRTSELVLAGLALGVSFGTKWYAVSSVAIVIAVWAVAMLIARRGVGTVVRQGLALCGLTALGGGIWLLRNWVESDNPLFPVKVQLLGQTIFDAPPDPIRESSGFALVHYFDQPDVWSETILPQLREALAGPGMLAVLGAIGAMIIVLLVRRRGRAGLPLRGVVLAGGVTFLLLTIAYVITPYTAGGPEGLPIVTGVDSRYWVPGLIVGLVLGAWAAGAWKRGPLVFSLLSLVVVVNGVDRTRVLLDFHPTKGNLAVIVIALIGLAAVAMAVVPALLPLQGRRELRAVAALCAVALLVLVIGFDRSKDHYASNRYLGVDPAADVLLTTAGSGNDVGLTGDWPSNGLAPPLPAFGPRFRNHVEYVGRPDRGVFRRFKTEGGFVAKVRRGDYDYLVIGQGKVLPATKRPREEAWARAAGYRLLKRSPRIALYGRT